MKKLGVTSQYILFSIFIIILSYFLAFAPLFSIPLLLWFFPFYFVMREKGINKQKKVGWLLLLLFLSWLGFAFYLISKKD